VEGGGDVGLEVLFAVQADGGCDDLAFAADEVAGGEIADAILDPAGVGASAGPAGFQIRFRIRLK